MDPVSAAGIGLSVSSLLLQVFAGYMSGELLYLTAFGKSAGKHG
jgi:hypothetical protein